MDLRILNDTERVQSGCSTFLFPSVPTSRTLSSYMDHPADRLLLPGTLLTTWLERTARARQCGAIQSIPTEPEVIEQSGVAFQVRVITALAMKAFLAAAPSNGDPFLPYDPDLFVTDLSPTHVALLNKFNVVEHHLLIVTRAFEEQTALLTREDCAALLLCLAEIDGLGFYNAGASAGASQRHKHLQLVPLSAFPDAQLPIARLLCEVRMDGATGTVPGFPFLHACAPMHPDWLGQGNEGASALLACYRSLLRAVGLADEAGSTPYNLLVTRQWLLLVPRAQEFFEGISINALAFAGALLVKDAAQLAILQQRGPMTALQQVALPRKP